MRSTKPLETKRDRAAYLTRELLRFMLIVWVSSAFSIALLAAVLAYTYYGLVLTEILRNKFFGASHWVRSEFHPQGLQILGHWLVTGLVFTCANLVLYVLLWAGTWVALGPKNKFVIALRKSLVPKFPEAATVPTSPTSAPDPDL